MSLKVFVSYAAADLKDRDRVVSNLGWLERDGCLSLMLDDRIQIGEYWQREVLRMIDEADVFLLLITPGFNKSVFIRDVELPRILEKSRGTGNVIPVWIDGQLPKSISHIQAVPKPSLKKQSSPSKAWHTALETLWSRLLDLYRSRTLRARSEPSIGPASLAGFWKTIRDELKTARSVWLLTRTGLGFEQRLQPEFARLRTPVAAARRTGIVPDDQDESRLLVLDPSSLAFDLLEGRIRLGRPDEPAQTFEDYRQLAVRLHRRFPNDYSFSVRRLDLPLEWTLLFIHPQSRGKGEPVVYVQHVVAKANGEETSARRYTPNDGDKFLGLRTTFQNLWYGYSYGVRD